MKRAWSLLTALALVVPPTALSAAEPEAKGEPAVKTGLKVGQAAPDFKIKDAHGKLIDLAELSAKGPVLVRLTCGCSGCDKELGYFQALHEAYKGQGLTSVAIFKEPDAKVESYVKEKKLQMLYAVDTDGKSWNIFQTKTMPTNFLIDKGGTIRAIAAGCDPSGLVAQNLSEKVAKLLGGPATDVQSGAKPSGK
ncbi:MAG: redoxin domain-containing protein [Planctomycetia bacterium]|nr:redoxin domain-containing protein [Planctomycetia bacterium]